MSFSRSFRASGWRPLDMWSSWWFWSQRLCHNHLLGLHLTCGYNKFFINSAAFITISRAWKVYDGWVSGYKVSLTFSAILNVLYIHPSTLILHSGSQGVRVHPKYVRVKVGWHHRHVNSLSQGHTERQKIILMLMFTMTKKIRAANQLTWIMGWIWSLFRKGM